MHLSHVLLEFVESCVTEAALAAGTHPRVPMIRLDMSFQRPSTGKSLPTASDETGMYLWLLMPCHCPQVRRRFEMRWLVCDFSRGGSGSLRRVDGIGENPRSQKIEVKGENPKGGLVWSVK